MGDRFAAIADHPRLRPARVAWKAARRAWIRDSGERARQRDRDALREPKLLKKRAARSSAARNAGHTGALAPTIRATLRMSAPGIPRAAREEITDQVVRVDRSAEYFDEATERVIEVVRSLDPSIVLPGAWVSLRHVLVRHGLLRAWVDVRNHARTSAHAHFAARPRDPEAAWLATKAHLDEGKAAAGTETLQRLRDLDYRHRAIPYLWRYLNAMGDNLEAGKEARRTASTELDGAFEALLRDRSIAIVGPAASGVLQGPVIDAHDIVVRLNFVSRTALPDPRYGGSRTDIVYLGRTATRKSTARATPDDFSDCQFLCAKIGPLQTHAFGEIPTRLFGDSMKSLRRVYFAGSSPNLVPGVLFDLLRFAPGKVTVFNTNFYLSESLYYKGYTGSGFSKSSDFFCTAASHEPFDQIHLVRNAAAGPTVDVDEECSATIGLDDKAAATRYEQVFRAAHWR